MTFLEELEWRRLVHGKSEGIEEFFKAGSGKGYIGFDPTAPSLHVGSLLPIICLVHLQKKGFSPIAIVGGGTGLIGDPSGKTNERQLLTKEKLRENLDGIKSQLSRFLDFNCSGNPAQLIDNSEWLCKWDLLGFLRDIGKYFSVNTMLAKDSVKNRLEREEGISFTEFSYQLLQGYDFLHLFEHHDCALEMGGSDQWGNIVAGIDLIRRLKNRKAHGLVFPLVTSSTGVKFGKTEAGAVWLDPVQTSPYRFFQFWLNTNDQDAATYLRYFTFLDQDRIIDLENQGKAQPEKRVPQKVLAEEVTKLVHGENALAKVKTASNVLFGGEVKDLSETEIEEIFRDVPSSEAPKADLEGQGLPLLDLLVRSKIAPSKGEARRLVEQGGIQVNNVKAADIRANITLSQTLFGKFLIVRKGSKSYHLVKVKA